MSCSKSIASKYNFYSRVSSGAEMKVLLVTHTFKRHSAYTFRRGYLLYFQDVVHPCLTHYTGLRN